MRTITKNIITISIAFFIISCSEMLDVEPQQSISQNTAISSEASINKLVVGLYESAGRRFSHGGYVQIFSDLLGSTNQVNWNGTFFEPREALNKKMDANNIIIDAIWKNLYNTIGQSNLVLDNLSIIKNDSEKNRVEGESRFLRALSYFELVRLFGNDIKGVPLRLKSVEDYAGDLAVSRASTADVYKAILEDINKATTLLPKENSFYADKYAALAISARINLYLGNYSAALAAANDIISNSEKKLADKYEKAFNNDENGTEDIFAMQVTSQSGSQELIQLYASQENGGRGGDISLTDAFLMLFDDPDDVRAHFYYENSFGDFLTNKYTNQFGNISVLRLAEMVLIRAECNQRLNSAVGAKPVDDINTLRLRSGAKLLDVVTLPQILQERERELAFEGFSIYDVKRTKKSIAGLNSTSPKLVMPIPQSEMDANKLMEQNEGY